MSGPLLHTEWRNNNERVNYPFADHATLVNSAGARVDRDLFDDARLYPIGGASGLFLIKILVESGEISFHIGDAVSGELASGGFAFGSVPDEILLTDIYGRPAGVLISDTDRLGALNGLYGEGEVEFEQEETEFAASVAVPMPAPGLRGLLLDDGNVVAGDIWLVGEDGVVLRMEDGKIRMDVIGDPYVLQKDCDDEGAPLPQFCGLKSINNITPDTAGDFKIRTGGNLAADPVVRVIPTTNGIQIKQVGTKGGIDHA